VCQIPPIGVEDFQPPKARNNTKNRTGGETADIDHELRTTPGGLSRTRQQVLAAIDHQLFSCDFVFFVVKNAFPDAMPIAAGIMARPHFLNALGRDVEIVIRPARHSHRAQTRVP
jgi:hypothetical protein